MDGVEDADSAVPDRVDKALQHLRRVTQTLITADQEVAVNVSNLRKNIDKLEDDVADAQEQAAVQQQRVEELQLAAHANNEKWAAKLDRKRRRVQALSDEVAELQKLNDGFVAENKQYKRELQLGELHSSALKDEKVNLKVEAEQDKLRFMESTVQELREQLKESRQQCKDADKAADKAELQLRAEELRAAAALKAATEESSKDHQLFAQNTAATLELEERVKTLTSELETANSRIRETESGMGQKSSE